MSGTSKLSSNGTSEYIKHYECLKKSRNVEKEATRILNEVDNAYSFILFCLKENEKGSGDKIIANKITKVIKIKEKSEDLSENLNKDIQNEAAEFAVSTKQIVLIRLIISCFKLHEVNEVFKSLIQEMIDNHKFKDAALMISSLHLQLEYKKEELLIPLFLLNQHSIIELYLEGNVDIAKEFLVFLDKIIGKEIHCMDLVSEYDFKQIKPVKGDKMLCNMIIRLIKKFDLDPSPYPHTIRRQYEGALRYLSTKYFKERMVTTTSYNDLAHDIVRDDGQLQHLFFGLLQDYGGVQSVVSYMKQYKINLTDVPSFINEMIEQEGINIDDEPEYHDIDNLNDKEMFYHISTPYENIYLINSISKFHKTLLAISESDVIGIDCEWKPSFCSFNLNVCPTLIQFAVKQGIHLIDVDALKPLLSSDDWYNLAKFFSDPTKVKLVYDYSGDKKGYIKVSSVFEKELKDSKNVIDMHNIKVNLKNNCDKYFEYTNEDFKGLSDLVYSCFGKPMDKMEQVSLWSIRPLSKSQIVYAATDAQCLLDVYTYLDTKYKSQGFPDWRTLNSNSKNDNLNKNIKNKKNVKDDAYRRENLKTQDAKFVCDTMIQVHSL